jgi:5-methylcytosine-specific restriction endonuclease McrA
MEVKNKIYPRTLILDSTYRAIHVVDWQDAMCLIILGKAEVVLYHENIEIRSTKESFKLPSILRVKCKRKIINDYINLTRMNVFKRDSFRCAYCGDHFTKKELTIDHIQPLSRNGDKKTWENLVSACGSCNHKKADKTPSEARMPLLYSVFKPKWSPKRVLNLGDNYPKEWEDWVY